MKLLNKLTALIGIKSNGEPAPNGGVYLNWGPYSGFDTLAHEPFEGAFQRNIYYGASDVTRYPPVYRCISIISGDLARMPWGIEQWNEAAGIWGPAPDRSKFSSILSQPNEYQTPYEFKQAIVMGLLTNGNTYIWKRSDNAGNVKELHVLRSRMMDVFASDGGDIVYQYAGDDLSGLANGSILFPRDVIHMRINPIFNPLVGVPPLAAAGIAAGLGLSMMTQSRAMFANGARPGGVVEGEKDLSKEQAEILRKQIADGYTGSNAGKPMVLTGGLKWKALNYTFNEAQLVEQLGWSSKTIAVAFGVPAYKIEEGNRPAYNDVQSLDRDYVNSTLGAYVSMIEDALTAGLRLPSTMRVQIDETGIDRMDAQSQMTYAVEGVKGGVLTVNRARQMIGEKPIDGGDTVYLQQQLYPIEQAANAIRPEAQPATPPIPEPAAPDPAEIPDDEAAKALEVFKKVMGARDAA